MTSDFANVPPQSPFQQKAPQGSQGKQRANQSVMKKGGNDGEAVLFLTENLRMHIGDIADGPPYSERTMACASSEYFTLPWHSRSISVCVCVSIYIYIYTIYYIHVYIHIYIYICTGKVYISGLKCTKTQSFQSESKSVTVPLGSEADC